MRKCQWKPHPSAPAGAPSLSKNLERENCNCKSNSRGNRGWTPMGADGNCERQLPIRRLRGLHRFELRTATAKTQRRKELRTATAAKHPGLQSPPAAPANSFPDTGNPPLTNGANLYLNREDCINIQMSFGLCVTRAVFCPKGGMKGPCWWVGNWRESKIGT